METSSKMYKNHDDCGIIIDFYDRYETVYPLKKFIWECYYGLLPSSVIVKSQNPTSQRIRDLYLVDTSKEYYKCIKCKPRLIVKFHQKETNIEKEL